MISEYQNDLRSEFQMVNDKIAKFKTQFLASSTQLFAPKQPSSKAIQIYKQNVKNTMSTEETPEQAKEAASMVKEDPY